jgi:hypothetical protein
MQDYRKYFGFIRNKAITKEIESLDPVKDHCRIVYLTTGFEFSWDMIRALEIALMKTFCNPRISGLLNRTGEFKKYGQKRYDDTALLVAEFMQNGYNGERGKFAIEHMKHIHGFYKIENDDFLFVLSTFIFQPIKWIDAYGWRKTLSNEREALFYFFKAVGERMHIHDIPQSLKEFEKWVESYEQQHIVLQETNTEVGNATVNIVKGWMPFFAKPFVFPVIKCLLDDDMLNALGYMKPPAALRFFVKGAMRLRALGLRKLSFRKYPSFFTTEKNRTYTKGYDMHELGPANLIKHIH